MTEEKLQELLAAKEECKQANEQCDLIAQLVDMSKGGKESAPRAVVISVLNQLPEDVFGRVSDAISVQMEKELTAAQKAAKDAEDKFAKL